MIEFDLLHTPLRGTNLVEASAGTGKTYTIEGIYIRLLLEEKITADQILVVTFTKAATDELKERIHAKLLETRNAIVSGKSDDTLIKSLLKGQNDSVSAEQLVCDALIDFDKAAIFTIHGFCQRILYENAFETGTPFDAELISDQSYLIQEICDDFWRKHFYDASPEFASYAVNRMGGPHYFYRLLTNSKFSRINTIPDIREQPPLTALPAFRAAFLGLVNSWEKARTEVLKQLHSPALNGTIYGGLKNNPGLGGRTKRDLKISIWADGMDRMLGSTHATLPVFPDLEKFTTTKLQRSTRKNQQTPVHPFFDLCQDFYAAGRALATELDTVIIYLKSVLIKYANAELSKRKQEKNIQYFDDLLLLVQKALTEKEGRALVEAVRHKYRVALVDEFQDTDNIQYEIFSKLFGTENSILFMIGDPKQAIYGFRGADIFSYLKASRTSKSQYTLTRNWRSTPGMITAVNTIFSKLPEPFVFKEIAFESAEPSVDVCQAACDDTAPFTIWYLDSRKFSDSGKPVSKSDAQNMTSAAVAEEIIRLSSSEGQTFDLGDIAVLVRTNKQARLVQHDLAFKNIPAVLHSTGNIFDAREAFQIQIILMSIAEPSNIIRLKTAMAMDIMPETAKALVHTDSDSTKMESRLEQMAQYQRIWDNSGFMRMFRQFLANEGIKERVLGFSGGERRLTNILHLAEILHHACVQKNLGIGGLIKWLAEQRNPDTPRLEEHQLRLESDDRAVKIVTVHKSKGLEYKIVFCPFNWDNADIRDEEFRFHDIENDWRPTLQLGGLPQNKHLGWARSELLAENLRLLYVALTRCREKCYLAWGRINNTESSALSYLLHRQFGQDRFVGDPGYSAIVENLRGQIAAKTDDDFLADLELLVRQSSGTIQVQSLPPRLEESRYFSKQVPEAIPSCRHFHGKINRQWRVSSYSTLVSTRATDTDAPDRDILQGHRSLPLETVEPTVGSTESNDTEDIFTFPKGTRAGLFFHDLLEHIDFNPRSFGDYRAIVAEKLQSYEFEIKWVDIVCRMLQEVVSLSLNPDEPELTLQSIAPSDRINELEFYFPLKTLTPGILQGIFKNRRIAEKFNHFPENLGNLTFSPSSGFVKGFIDMIFQFKGRYYLVDWKSNYLGATIENYRRRHLDQNMMDHYYVLQYHLYTLALYRYLQSRHPDFNYKHQFGGVYYIFLRGVDHNRGSDFGLFFDKPDPELVNALESELIPVL